jgi:hypothetical protein
LDVLVRLGFVLYDAQTDIGWAGDASVTVSIVHAATGSCRADVQKFLNDRPVAELSTALTGGVVYGTPRNLAVNANRSFQGMIVLGLGFTLTPEERDEFVAADPRNAERIFPYLGGREVNSHPEQMFDRYVIDFADMPLEEAAQWPGLIERLERLVKPERELQKRNALRDRWWQYADKRPALRRALEGLPRCLVTSCHSPHLIFVWQPSTRLFSHGLYVFPTASDSLFAILQSRPHEVWARRFGSSMETRLRYTATDVFETFPFPPTPSMVADGPLWQAGETLYAARAEVMKQRWIGLTKLYNALHDPHEPAADLQHLRHLHQTLDEQVCLAYGWPDLASTVPPYGAGHAESAATLAWQAQVLERLWGLNGG